MGEHGSAHAGKLGGKVALVTGGGQGIGRAISLALAGEGAHVVVVGRTLEKVKRVAEAIHRQHGQATPLSVDLTVKADVTRMVETVLAGPGRIDLLINNAAVMRRAPIVEM